MLLLFGGLFAATYIIGTLVELHGIPYTNFRGEYNSQQEEAFRQLNLVADLKKARLQRWIKERKADIAVFSKDVQFSFEVGRLFETIREKTDRGLSANQLGTEIRQSDAYNNLHMRLTTIKAAYPEYESVSIIDWSTLTIIVSSDSHDLGGVVTAPLHADSEYILHDQDAYVSDVVIDKHDNQPSLYLVGAVMLQDSGDRQQDGITGLLVIRVNPDDVFKPILHTGGGLGKTGEVVLVNRKPKNPDSSETQPCRRLNCLTIGIHD